jgi:hypothetical protein
MSKSYAFSQNLLHLNAFCVIQYSNNDEKRPYIRAIQLAGKALIDRKKTAPALTKPGGISASPWARGPGRTGGQTAVWRSPAERKRRENDHGVWINQT